MRWLSITATDDGFTLRRHDVLDDGSDDFLDVYEFRPVNEDEYVGEGILLDSFPDAPAALEAATGNGSRMTGWGWGDSGRVRGSALSRLDQVTTFSTTSLPLRSRNTSGVSAARAHRIRITRDAGRVTNWV